MKLFSLSVDKRIKSRKDLDKLYSSGKVIYSKEKKIKAIYMIEQQNEKFGTKIAVVVSKKAGNAVWRNKIKRLLRESSRLHLNNLMATTKKKRTVLKIIFSPVGFSQKKNKKIGLEELKPEVVEVLTKLESVV